MADNDHSLFLLDFLDTIEIRSQCVVLERVHPFEELNEKKFCGHFRLSKCAILHILSEARKITVNKQLQLIPNTDDSLTMYYTL